MPQLPSVTTSGRRQAAAASARRGVTFAVYAAIGTDPRLSRFPATDPNAPIPSIRQQALVRQLRRVAERGVNVSALIDLYGDATYLVEIPAFKPDAMVIASAWKQNMADPHALAGFLTRAHTRFPCEALVLSIDGHGGGYMPDVDAARITPFGITHGTLDGKPIQLRWVLADGLWTAQEVRAARDAGGGPRPRERGLTVPEMGTLRSMPAPQAARDAGTGGDPPPLGITVPEMPAYSPVQPAMPLPMSTWGYGEALRLARKAGVPKLAVIHFNNCFNGSFELLHTVAPYADHASGYANYDFFTAGAIYPKVFGRLQQQGSATAGQLAQWFAIENGQLLKSLPGHPIIGGTVALSRMATVAARIETLAGLLAAAMSGGGAGAARQKLQAAATLAQHYDTDPTPNFELQAPDHFVDVASLAAQVQAAFGPGPIGSAAAALQTAVAGIWQTGWQDQPSMAQAPRPTYDFRDQTLGLNIFFPDPARSGRWDWRTPYYIASRVDPAVPPALAHQIAFLSGKRERRPDWVAMLAAYHQETAFVGFLPPQPPFTPLANPDFRPGGDNPAGTPGKPGRRR